MLLSDRKIKEEMEKGNIVIEPFDPRQLGSNSYDVRLGENYYTQTHGLTIVDFTKELDTRRFWGKPHKADLKGRITIKPGETILAHTEEVIGGRNGVTTSMRARSSIGRCGLSVCKCAGVGDVGYIARWTMEISNHTQSTIVLKVGMRIGQMEFYYIGETDKVYSGKYGVDDWTPEDMLPKLYLDKY